MNDIQKEENSSNNFLNGNYIQSLASIALATSGGMIIGGVPGAAIGLLAGIADEKLIHDKQSSKHYVAGSAYYLSAYAYPASKTLIKYFPQYEMPIYAAMTSVAAVMALLNK
jgi:hypothetical protein